MKTEIVIFGEPTPKARPRFVRGHAYTPGKTAAYEETVGALYRSKYKTVMYERHVPVRMDITFYFSVAKSDSKKIAGQKLRNELLPVGKSDIDNCIKSCLDGLNRIAYYDDAQVVEITCRKRYAEKPRTVVVMEEVVTCRED